VQASPAFSTGIPAAARGSLGYPVWMTPPGDSGGHGLHAEAARENTWRRRPAYMAFNFSFMWLITWVCSRCGLNMMISASTVTFTLCPAGQ